MELYIVTVGLPGVLFDKEITYYNVVSVIKYYEFKR